MEDASKEPDRRMTLIDAARILGLSEGQVRRRVLQGELEGGQDLGRWWYVTRESVERYLEREQAEAAEATG